MDCSLILQTDAMPPNFAKKLSLVVTKPLKFAKVFSPESIRYPLPLHLHVNVGYLIDPNATTAAWLTAFEGCSRLRSCPKLMGSEFTSAIQKKRENKKMCFTDVYGTIFTCTLQIYGSIRKSITIVNFSRKGSDWENDNWNSGSRNEHKRSLDSPIVPSVCFSAIVVSFCGDQCQYNSGYATNLLVARHLVFWRVILLLFFYRRGFTASKSSVRKVYLELSYWLRTDTV